MRLRRDMGNGVAGQGYRRGGREDSKEAGDAW